MAVLKVKLGQLVSRRFSLPTCSEDSLWGEMTSFFLWAERKLEN